MDRTNGKTQDTIFWTARRAPKVQKIARETLENRASADFPGAHPPIRKRAQKIPSLQIIDDMPWALPVATPFTAAHHYEHALTLVRNGGF